MSASDRLLELSDEVVTIRSVVSGEKHDAVSRDTGSFLTILSEQLQANESIVDADFTAEATTGQVRTKAADAVIELFDKSIRTRARR